MTDIHWTSYVGMIAGVAGVIMGYIAFRRSHHTKARDMRIELRKDINYARSSLSELQKLLPYANKSRQRVAAATGNLRSSRLQLWQEGFKSDSELLDQIFEAMPSTAAHYIILSHKGLEQRLIYIHLLQVQIDQLTNKYKAAIQEDDQVRLEIREDHRGR